MRRFAPFLLLAAPALLGGCDAGTGAQAQNAPDEIRTIHSTTPRPAPLQPPPMLLDEAPPPKPKVMPWETPKPIIFTPEDDKIRTSLPFTPAIAMDPVNGDKISIRATTPTFEYKGRIYYFSSPANFLTFKSNPAQFVKEGFTKL